MKNRYDADNYYIDSLTANLTLTPSASWATTIPVNTVPSITAGKFSYAVLKPFDSTSRVTLRVYVSWGVLKVNNRDIPVSASFLQDDPVGIFDEKNLFKASFKQIDDFWYTELKSGLIVTIYWGEVLSWGITAFTIPDAALTLPDNSTSYIYCNVSWLAFASSTVAPIYPILATVVTLSWAVTSITDSRPVNLAWWTSTVNYFHDLLDTFEYSGNASKIVRVKSDETWLEAVTVATINPNADNTTAGIVKVANSTQIAAGTATAPYYAVTTKDVVKTSSGAADENKLPVLASTWLIDAFVSVASETAKGLVERATDIEAAAWIDTERYITPKQYKDNLSTANYIVSSSSNLKFSADTERSTNNTSYTLLKEIIIYETGTVKVDFDIKNSSDISGACKWKVYKNDVAISAEETNATTTYSTKTATITNVYKWDRVQLYIKQDTGGQTAFCKNFRISYDKAITTWWTVTTD